MELKKNSAAWNWQLPKDRTIERGLVRPFANKRRNQIPSHVRTKVATCTCPDYETRGLNCKHIYAATFVMRRERKRSGTMTVTESLTVTETKQTYSQNWSAYNQAQTHEQDKFQLLLADLCSGLTALPASRTGRPRLPTLRCALFMPRSKSYSTVSQRRFMRDLRAAHRARIYLQSPPLQLLFPTISKIPK